MNVSVITATPVARCLSPLCLHRTFGNAWRHVWLSWSGEEGLLPVSWVRGPGPILHRTALGKQRCIHPALGAVLRLRNPAVYLGPCYQPHKCVSPFFPQFFAFEGSFPTWFQLQTDVDSCECTFLASWLCLQWFIEKKKSPLAFTPDIGKCRRQIKDLVFLSLCCPNGFPCPAAVAVAHGF